MPIVNPFTSDMFNMISLTNAINRLPNMYGRIRELNIFPYKGQPTRKVVVDEKDGVLNLLPLLPPGAPGTVAKTGERRARTFQIPHIPHDSVILPEDVQGVRRFGSENMMYPWPVATS